MRERTVTYLRKHALKGPATDAVFSALADPTRRALLELLRRERLPAGRMAKAFPVSRPAISKHLRVLRRARLVRERRTGRQRVYQLNPGPLRTIDSWLAHYRAFWETSLTGLKDFVEEKGSNGISELNVRKSKRKTTCQEAF